MKRIRTQRAMALYDLDRVLIDASNPDVLICNEGAVPVLVVLEADVSRCKHDNETPGAYCPDCGSYRRWSDSRWQRPRILRVARGKR